MTEHPFKTPITVKQPQTLDENLGETLLILKRTLEVSEGRAVHAEQAAGCLDLAELQAKMTELHQKLVEAELFSQPRHVIDIQLRHLPIKKYRSPESAVKKVPLDLNQMALELPRSLIA